MEVLKIAARQQLGGARQTFFVMLALVLILAVADIALTLKSHGRITGIAGLPSGMELRALTVRGADGLWRDRFKYTQVQALDHTLTHARVLPVVSSALQTSDGQRLQVLIAAPELIESLRLSAQRDPRSDYTLLRVSTRAPEVLVLDGVALPSSGEVLGFRGLGSTDLDMLLDPAAAALVGLDLSAAEVWRALFVADDREHLARISTELDGLRTRNALPFPASAVWLEDRIEVGALAASRIDYAVRVMILACGLLAALALPLLWLRADLRQRTQAPAWHTLGLLGASPWSRMIDALADAILLCIFVAIGLTLAESSLRALVIDAFSLSPQTLEATDLWLRMLLVGSLVTVLGLLASVPSVRWRGWRQPVVLAMITLSSAMVVLAIGLALGALLAWSKARPDLGSLPLDGLRVLRVTGTTCKDGTCLNMDELNRRLQAELGADGVAVALSMATHPLPNESPMTTRAVVGERTLTKVENNPISGNYLQIIDPSTPTTVLAANEVMVDSRFAQQAGLENSSIGSSLQVSKWVLRFRGVYGQAARGAWADAVPPVAYTHVNHDIYGFCYVWLRGLSADHERRVMARVLAPLGLSAHGMDAQMLLDNAVRRERAVAVLLSVLALICVGLAVLLTMAEAVRALHVQRRTLATLFALGLSRGGVYVQWIGATARAGLLGVVVAAASLPLLLFGLQDTIDTKGQHMVLLGSTAGLIGAVCAAVGLAFWLWLIRQDIGSWLRPTGEAND